MRIIHTADWHIGQQLHGFSRHSEHEAFLRWLHQQCQEHSPDALVVAGDVFHHANPTSDAVELFASFAERLLGAMPAIKIVAVAGNHDSPSRFDALRPIVRSGVHLTGAVPRAGEAYDIAPMLIRAGDGAILAMPYLRLSDLPQATDGDTAADRVRTAYEACFEQATALLKGAPCVITGHLHVSGGEESTDSERPLVVGGEDAIPPSFFPAEAAYIALGHLHRPQKFAGGRIRYCGSPFPLSAAERDYKHRVVLVDVASGGALNARDLFVPRTVAHLRIPATGAVEPEGAQRLIELAVSNLALTPASPSQDHPFVEVCLKLSAKHAMAASKLIQDIAQAKLPVRIVKVTPVYENVAEGANHLQSPPSPKSARPPPEALFAQAFAMTHGGLAPTPAHQTVFHEAWRGVET